MKKKGNRSIPDFSRKKPTGSTPVDNKVLGSGQKPPRVQVGKPQATSAKSGGRRGS